MDELLDMVVNDASASDITDKIKDILYTKSSERIDGMNANVGGRSQYVAFISAKSCAGLPSTRRCIQ